MERELLKLLFVLAFHSSMFKIFMDLLLTGFTPWLSVIAWLSSLMDGISYTGGQKKWRNRRNSRSNVSQSTSSTKDPLQFVEFCCFFLIRADLRHDFYCITVNEIFGSHNINGIYFDGHTV